MTEAFGSSQVPVLASAQDAPPLTHGNGRSRGLRAELSMLDRQIYQAVARQNTPALDRLLRVLSEAANKSVLWGVLAGTLAATGGRHGRRAASRGMAAIGVTSAFCNLALKPLYNRRRPQRSRLALSRHRRVRMPGSSSFPSGHSASAFAFATAVGIEVPVLSVPFHALAVLVAYSRVHTGVHYPGDVIAGAVIGTATGQIVTRLADRRSTDGGEHGTPPALGGTCSQAGLHR